MSSKKEGILLMSWGKHFILFSILLSIIASRSNAQGSNQEVATILELVTAFSKKVVANDYDGIANAYTESGKIFPNNRAIITGREDIRKYWIQPETRKVLSHQIFPEEINIVGETAYDYGYYQITTQDQGKEPQTTRGKYVIVWKKTNGQWKIHLDIWNRADQ
ncbi:MAG: DUF4440 domain-containing protein [Cyclobacteriaceae bacterium]